MSVAKGWADFQGRNGLVADGKPGAKTLELVLDLEGRATTRPTHPGIGRFQLSELSIQRMRGVHPDLQAVVHFAIRVTKVDFGVTGTGGVRTLQMQRELVDAGKSKTMNSRHLTGHAVDVFAYRNGKAAWSMKDALVVHDAFEQAAEALAVPIRWGGDWDGDGDWRDERFVDAFHHELRRDVYGTGTESRSLAAREYLSDLGVQVA